MDPEVKPLGTGAARPSTDTIKYPIPDSNDVEDIVSAVREIFRKHQGAVYSVNIISGVGIEVQIDSSAQRVELDRMPFLLADIVRKIELIPIPSYGESPEASMGRVLQRVSADGGYPAFLVVGDRRQFVRWFTAGVMEQLKSSVMGMTLHEAPGAVPADAAIICATPTKLAIPTEVFRGYLLRLDRPRPKERQI